MESPQKVIDASVVVKWYNKEDFSPQADFLKEGHISGRLTLVAPHLLVFEVSNALRFNPDFEVQDVVEAVDSLLDMQIDLHPSQKEWMEKSIELAFKIGITLYDSVYIGLADVLGTTVITADEQLIKKTKHPRLVHIKDVWDSSLQ